MKVIIAISAKGKTGKSSALLSLFNSGILQTPTFIHPQRFPIKKEVTAWGNYIFQNGQVSTKLAGINSLGDKYKAINTNLTQLINGGCEVIITACRNEGTKSFDAVKTLALQNQYELITTMHYSNYQQPRVSQSKQTGTPHILNGVNLTQLFVSHLRDLIDQLI